MATATAIEQVKISDLRPYKKNAKIHGEEQVQMIAASIQEFWFVSPCLIDRDLNLIAGHGRVEAAKRIGMTEVPCVYVEGLTDEQRRAYILADNRLGELAEWDMELVQEELAELADLGFDVELTGFELLEEGEEQEAEEDGYSGEDAENAPTRCQTGDVWQLGQHRLICGDCTDPAVIAELMDGEKADLYLTDPPYNVAIGSKNKLLNEKYKGGPGNRIETDIAGDKGMTDEEIGNLLWLPAFKNARDNANDSCSIYLTMPQGGTHMVMMMMVGRAGWQVKHELIWVKNRQVFSMGRLDYEYKHEPILYGWNKSHVFYTEECQTSVFEDTKTEFSKMKKDELVKLLENIFADKKPVSVIKEDMPINSLHPTMKPVKLMGRLIKNSSQENEIVLDTFGGSGSTLIACEQLNRKCYMSELDPHYCDVIIDRWEQFTGEKAEKI